MKKPFLKSFADLYEKLAPKGLIPPQAVDLEQSLLGAMMIDKASARTAIEIIGRDVKDEGPFYRDAHTLVYRSIVSIEETNAIDLLTVKEAATKLGVLDKIGGPAYLVELTTKVDNTVNVGRHAHLILEKYVLREAIRICSDFSLKSYEGECDAFELVSELEIAISDLSEIRHNKTGRFRTAYESGFETIKILDNIQRGKQSPGIPFGFQEVDRLTGGSQKGDLIVLGARPSMGKSSIGIAFAEAASLRSDSKISTACISLEMPSNTITRRMLCGLAGVSLYRARMGYLNDDEWKRIMKAQGELAESGVHLFDQRGVNFVQIGSALRHLAAKLARTSKPLGRVILDHIGLPDLPGKDNRANEIGDLAFRLATLAGELDTDMIVLSQINRESTKRTDPRPVLSDLSESGKLEMHARLTMLLYRPEQLGIPSQESYMNTPLKSYRESRGESIISTEGIGEIIIAKQSEGPTGVAYVKFLKDHATFEDLPFSAPEFETAPLF